MSLCSFPPQITGSIHKHSIPDSVYHVKTSLASSLKKTPMKFDAAKTIRNTSRSILDMVFDSVFKFVDQPYLPSQSNFAPVEEMGEAMEVVRCIEGKVPIDFPEGVYIRNGPNPLFGGLKTAYSIFGRSSHIWIEGEGMLHALYFSKNARGDLIMSYKNRYVESKTFKLEKEINKPSFLPAVEGDSPAILAAYLFNMLRFNMATKHMSNTNIFKHAGKLFSITESYIPQEIDIATLDMCGDWDLNGAWDRPFTSHPKRVPLTGELVTMGVDAVKPFFVVGVISADGKKLLHKVDLKFNRCVLPHEIGVTEKYNIILDYPLVLDRIRLVKGGPLVKYIKEDFARIGVMPRYGDAESVKWFEEGSCCMHHIFNCFEDGNEVVVRGCSADQSIYPGPDYGKNKFEWFSRGFTFTKSSQEKSDDSMQNGYLFHRPYEYRLNMETGEFKKRFVTGTDLCMDFPFINENFTGLKHKYGYTQVIDSSASSNCGMGKYGGLAKLYFNEPLTMQSLVNKSEEPVKMEYHKFPNNSFCSGSVFVSKELTDEEDDGWVLSFVHNEENNVSQVHIIDAKKFESEPIAKITLPRRVPYGFHGTFVTAST